jgi:hypothetical protein
MNDAPHRQPFTRKPPIPCMLREIRAKRRLVKTVVSNSTFDREVSLQLTLSRSTCSRMGEKLEIGSSGWTRTSNPPVNRLTQVHYLVDSSCL